MVHCLNLANILPLLEESHVPECSESLDRPLTESDFLSYKKKCEDNLNNINICLSRTLKDISVIEANRSFQLNENDNYEVVVAHLLILCGEHSALDLWSTKSTIETASDITNCILQLFSKNTISELLLENCHSIFKKALFVLRPKLLSSTWKCNPAAVISYFWLLMQVKAPYLNDHLSDVLPTALIITDDFEASNRIKGLQSINHIVTNVTKTDLEMYGYNEVILEGLRPILYHNESDILEPLLNCYLSLMRKMDVLPQLNYTDVKRNKFDDVLEMILNSFALEERHTCKIIYLKLLPDMICTFRLQTLRHSQNLFEMVVRELRLEATDYIKGLVLEVLDSTVKSCWPRLHQERLLRSVILALLKVVHDLSFLNHGSEPSYSCLLFRIKTSMQLLKNFDMLQLEQIRNDIRNNVQLEENFKTLVDFVLN